MKKKTLGTSVINSPMSPLSMVLPIIFQNPILIMPKLKIMWMYLNTPPPPKKKQKLHNFYCLRNLLRQKICTRFVNKEIRQKPNFRGKSPLCISVCIWKNKYKVYLLVLKVLLSKDLKDTLIKRQILMQFLTNWNTWSGF